MSTVIATRVPDLLADRWRNLAAAQRMTTAKWMSTALALTDALLVLDALADVPDPTPQQKRAGEQAAAAFEAARHELSTPCHMN